MYCSECGYKLEDDALVCPQCGTKVEEETVQENAEMPEDMEAAEEDAGASGDAGMSENAEMSEDMEAAEDMTVPEDADAFEEASEETKKGRVTALSLAKVIDRRVDRCFQTKPGKIVWGVLAAGAAASICILAGKGILVQKNYGWLHDYQLTEANIGELETKLETSLQMAAEAEQTAGDLSARYEYLAAYDLGTDWETAMKKQITERSAENQMLVQQFKARIMEYLGYTYTPSYNQRQYEDLGLDGFRNEAIDAAVGDSAVGGILGEGLKSALDAAAENSSLDNILAGAKEGLIDGTVGYVQDEIIGDLGNSVLDVFHYAEEIKNRVESMGTVPPEALNRMMEQQQKYLEEMQQFVEKERITREDMLDVYDAFCSYDTVLYTIQRLEGGAIRVSYGADRELEKMIGRYSRNEELIRKCIELAEEEQE